MMRVEVVQVCDEDISSPSSESSQTPPPILVQTKAHWCEFKEFEVMFRVQHGASIA